MPEDPIRLSAIDFFEDLLPEEIDEQVKVEFEITGSIGGDSELLVEIVPCSLYPSHEEYAQIVRNAAAALHKRLVRSAAFLASKYNL